VDRSLSRDLILKATPVVVANKLALVLLYDAALNIRELQFKATAVWVDLVSLHPVFEAEANRMLECIGPLVHSTVAEKRSQFQHIRGCVLIDITEDLTEGLVMKDANGNRGMIEVKYRDLPEMCFVCRKEGHLLRLCPVRQTGTGKGTDVRMQDARFVEERGRRVARQKKVKHTSQRKEADDGNAHTSPGADGRSESKAVHLPSQGKFTMRASR
jgi:hypothetical protein